MWSEGCALCRVRAGQSVLFCGWWLGVAARLLSPASRTRWLEVCGERGGVLHLPSYLSGHPVRGV